MLNLIWFYFLHKCGHLDIHAIHHKAFQSLFRNRKDSEFRLHAESFAKEFCCSLINESILRELTLKKDRGEQVMILSSSPDFLVRAFAREMKVLDWEATVYQTNPQGCYASIEKVLEGVEKSKRVKQIVAEREIPLNNTSAYSDSYHDVCFLDSVAHPVAVNPEKKLRRVCDEKGWTVVSAP